MGNLTWDNALDPFQTARGTAAANFTTTKDISPGPTQKVLAQNELKVGSVLDLEAWGEYSSVTTPTFQLGFAYGITSLGGLLSTGIILAASDLVATVSGAAAFPWHLRMQGVVTSAGATGVMYCHGLVELGASLISFGIKPIPITAAARSVTLDTTVQKALSVVAQWGTAAAGNTVTCDLFTAKVVNQGKTG